MLFVEFPNFTKRVTELLNDEEYRRLQAALIANPELGDLIRGTGGLRKARWQSQFAKMIRVSVKTLQNWEQKRRSPTGPVAALLQIVAREPQVALRTLHGPKRARRHPETGRATG